MGRRTRHHEGCEIDMTPMIDVVFQLIIFFIVTMTIKKDINEEIKLEVSPHGTLIEEQKDVLVLEVDRYGTITINNRRLQLHTLRSLMRGRRNRMGNFPVMIRADKLTRHRDVKKVMDVCTEIGIWRINFVAIKEIKATA